MVDRIKLILEKQDLTPAGFADTIGVQRSGMSHVLNGRNKPSLDFIVKTLQHFPAINPDWLLTGEGEMYRPASVYKSRPMPAEPTIFDVLSAQSESEDREDSDIHDILSESNNLVETPSSSHHTVQHEEQASLREEEPAVYHSERSRKNDPHVDQVIIFYSDHSCTVYRPNQEKK